MPKIHSSCCSNCGNTSLCRAAAAPPPPAETVATAAAVLESLLPADFIASLDDGSGKADYNIADVVEELAERQEALRQGLQQVQGVKLFEALDRKGDGTVAREGLREALAYAVASRKELLEFFVEACKPEIS